jgi:hypothetical protein
MRFQTTSGGYVTAANKTEAAAMAALYGMGEIACAVAAPKAAKAAVREGRVFGCWDAPVAIHTAAAAAYRGDGMVMFWGGEFAPHPLNSAELALVRRMIEEAE